MIYALKIIFEWVKLDWLLENKAVKCQFWHGMWQWDLESLFSISRSDKLNFWPRKILCYISISVPLCTQKPSAAAALQKKKKLISMSMEFMNSSVLSILITHSFWHLLKRFSLEKVTKLNYILMSWWIHFWPLGLRCQWHYFSNSKLDSNQKFTFLQKQNPWELFTKV